MADGRKAEVNPPRMLLKSHSKKGGVVRLWWPDDAVGPGLGIAEGVETALTLARVGLPVWSCVDAAGLAALPVLPGLEAITIAEDADEAGRAAAAALAKRYRDAGVEVTIVSAA